MPANFLTEIELAWPHGDSELLVVCLENSSHCIVMFSETAFTFPLLLMFLHVFTTFFVQLMNISWSFMCNYAVSSDLN